MIIWWFVISNLTETFLDFRCPGCSIKPASKWCSPWICYTWLDKVTLGWRLSHHVVHHWAPWRLEQLLDPGRYGWWPSHKLYHSKLTPWNRVLLPSVRGKWDGSERAFHHLYRYKTSRGCRYVLPRLSLQDLYFMVTNDLQNVGFRNVLLIFLCSKPEKLSSVCNKNVWILDLWITY